MTATEIIKKLEENFQNNRDCFAYQMDNTEEFGEAPIVDEAGDCEGGGDYSMVVRHFKKFDVYIMQTGFYSSYNGTDWNDDFKEVKPTQKTITVYE